MMSLIAAAVFFVAIHLLISGTRIRDGLVARIGLRPYLGLFVVLSWIGLIWLGWSYANVRHTPANVVYWGVTPTRRAIQMALQVVALFFIVSGLTTRNPTMVRGEANLERPDIVRGMLRVTRHPFLWGLAIWALGHLVVNGDLASFILFGSLLLLAAYGTASIDAKRRRALGPSWEGFAAQTSNLPFGAIAAGRQRLALSEIGWWRLGLVLVVAAVLALAHPYLFGVRAMP
jgi:uncharacterized membrane protein